MPHCSTGGRACGGATELCEQSEQSGVGLSFAKCKMKKEQDPDVSEKVKLAHEIQQLFRYTYGDQWVPEKVMKNQSRIHNQVFNELVKQGFIERKKTWNGYSYRWNAKMPDIS